MMKVLITGAGGFIGYHLILAALRNDLQVIAAVRKGTNIEHLRALPITFVQMEFSNKARLSTILESVMCDYIIHAAGLTKAAKTEEYFRVNADITLTLAEAAMQAQIPMRKFVFISSLAALGPVGYEAAPITESHPPAPITSYGKSKLLAEQYLSDVKDLPLMVFRPTAVYGPRERDILFMFKSINMGIEPYLGNIAQKLSFVYAGDLADVIVRGMLIYNNFKTYNISDGNIYSRYALADTVKQILEKKTLKVHVPLRAANILSQVLSLKRLYSNKALVLNAEKLLELGSSNWACSIEMIKKDLDFKPVHDLGSGLIESMQWYKEHQWL